MADTGVRGVLGFAIGPPNLVFRALRTSALVVGALLLAGGLFVAMRLEDRLIFFPTRGGHVQGPGSDVRLTTADGLTLHARHVATPGASKTLLYLHGNAGNLASRSWLLQELAGLGVHVFAPDYRGYGQSEGAPSEAGLYLDSNAAYQWLVARTPASSIIVLGESLGGGPACELAATHAVGGLILLSTFTSVPAMAQQSFPFLPTRLLVRTRFDNLEKITRVRVPKLIVHSRADEIIPFHMAERLYQAAPPPKSHLWLDRAGHNDTFAIEREPLVSALHAFIHSEANARPR